MGVSKAFSVYAEILKIKKLTAEAERRGEKSKEKTLGIFTNSRALS
jgi:hypothetical protein